MVQRQGHRGDLADVRFVIHVEDPERAHEAIRRFTGGKDGEIIRVTAAARVVSEVLDFVMTWATRPRTSCSGSWAEKTRTGMGRPASSLRSARSSRPDPSPRERSRMTRSGVRRERKARAAARLSTALSD